MEKVMQEKWLRGRVREAIVQLGGRHSLLDIPRGGFTFVNKM